MAEVYTPIVYLGLLDHASDKLSKKRISEAAYGMLGRMATTLVGLPSDQLNLTIRPSGKPAFTLHPEIHFSLSHSGSLAACAIGRLESGLDLEVMRKRPGWRDIATFWFSRVECFFLEERGDRSLESFYHLWTVKESWLKLFGVSVWRINEVPFPGAYSLNGLSAWTWEGDLSARFSLSLCVKSEGRDFRVSFPSEFNPPGAELRSLNHDFFPPGP